MKDKHHAEILIYTKKIASVRINKLQNLGYRGLLQSQIITVENLIILVSIIIIFFTNLHSNERKNFDIKAKFGIDADKG
jgi:hypothetical protein